MDYSRRDFLKGFVVGLGAISLGFGGYLSHHGRSETRADKLLKEFPTEIPGARSIRSTDRYIVQDSEKLLVHIRQTHKSSDDEEPTPSIISVQKNIYQILDYFVNRGADEVYLESNFADEETMEKLRDIDYSSLSVDEQYFHGGARVLGREGKLNLLAPETFKGSSEGYRALLRYLDKKDTLTKEQVKDLYRLIFDERENIALDLISRNENPMNLLVFGGQHMFINNVYYWNQKYPDKKYSLVEVTPDSYF